MKKNISFIIPNLRDGGAERVLSNMSINMDDSYNQSIVVWDGENVDYPYKGKLVDLKIKNKDSLIGKLYTFISRVKACKKYKKENNISASISLLEGPNMVNILSRNKEKVIVTVHNFQSKERNGVDAFIYKSMMKFLYNKADLVVTVSKNIKLDLIENFDIKENKIKVIYNPFDIDRIQSMMNEEIEEKHQEIFNHPVVINVGRLTNQKAQWHLIKSFSKAKEEINDAKLVILGQGELEPELKELIKKMGVEKDVHMLGFQKNPFKYVNKSKVFALSSLYEGFPMCLAESMACNTSVISVDCKSGPREMLDPSSNILEEATELEFAEFGILTPAFNDNSENILNEEISKEELIFSKGLIKLLENKDLRKEYVRVAEERVKHFDVKNILQQWYEII